MTDVKIYWGSFDPHLDSLLRPNYSYERSKKIGLEITRKCFTQMLLLGATGIYMWSTTECDRATNTYRLDWHFDVDRPEGQECVHYDCTNLLYKTDEEFEKFPHDENYGLVKSWRQILRGEK